VALQKVEDATGLSRGVSRFAASPKSPIQKALGEMAAQPVSKGIAGVIGLKVV
jgi:hypothetical protein